MTEIGSRKLYFGASASLVCLILICLSWETIVSPFRPGNYIFAIKALPLILALSGVFAARIYTMQWASMLVLLYFMEGIVRATGDADLSSRWMAGLEIVFSLIFYACAIFYVRPFKRIAKAKQKAVTEPVSGTQTAEIRSDKNKMDLN